MPCSSASHLGGRCGDRIGDLTPKAGLELSFESRFEAFRWARNRPHGFDDPGRRSEGRIGPGIRQADLQVRSSQCWSGAELTLRARLPRLPQCQIELTSGSADAARLARRTAGSLGAFGIARPVGLTTSTRYRQPPYARHESLPQCERDQDLNLMVGPITDRIPQVRMPVPETLSPGNIPVGFQSTASSAALDRAVAVLASQLERADPSARAVPSRLVAQAPLPNRGRVRGPERDLLLLELACDRKVLVRALVPSERPGQQTEVHAGMAVGRGTVPGDLTGQGSISS